MKTLHHIKSLTASAVLLSALQFATAEEYVLKATDAKLINKVRLLPKSGAVEYWQKPNSGASWTFTAEEDCDATVFANMAVDKTGGGVVKVLLDGIEVLTEDITSTGNWLTYKRIDLGDIELEEGEHTLKILSKKHNKLYFANLKSVILDSEGELIVKSSGKSNTAKWGNNNNKGKWKKNQGGGGGKVVVSNNGKLTLKAGTGKIKGSLKYQNSEKSYGWWKDKGAGVEWKVNLKDGGLMDVFVMMSGDDTAGGEIEILVDGKSELIAEVAPSGDWAKYSKCSLGVLFMKSGKHTVTVRSHSINDEFLGNMRDVVITK